MPEAIELHGLSATVERPLELRRPPVLFIHGMNAGAWVWERYQRFFADRGYPGYAIDLRGHHGSKTVADLGRVAFADFVEDARGAARALGRPIVVGHSMGGLIAQKLAESDLSAATVLISAAAPKGISMTTPALVRRQLRYLPQLLLSRPLLGSRADNEALVFNRVPDESERAALDARFVPESGRAAREMALGQIAVDVRRVRAPMLVVVGADDAFVGPRIARALARRYHAPLRIYPRHAHWIVAEPDWETPAADIERWIAHVVPDEDDRQARDARDALWAALKQRIGETTTLRFFDGAVLACELVNVDLADFQSVTYEVREVVTPSAGMPSSASGAIATAALSEIVQVGE